MAVGIPLTLLAGCQELQGLDERVSKNARAKSCEFLEHHVYWSRPVDLGNGIAGQYEYAQINIAGLDKFPHTGGWKATQCKTGQQVLVDVSDYGTFSDQAKALEKSTLEAFEELAESQGLETRATLETEEACGCAAFYPEMIGNKKPAFQRDGMPAWSEL